MGKKRADPHTIQAIELEMQSLKAQMNPHFIFNCLNSINKYIMKNEAEAASDHLIKFSRLIRMIIKNFSKPLVSLDDELEMLRLYMDLEQVRFNNSFDYEISAPASLDASSILIPPLLIQPVCENAIWHGLLHRPGRGMISIKLNVKAPILTCSIIDNGIGRAASSRFNSQPSQNEKLQGLLLTKTRLALHNGSIHKKNYYEMTDIKNETGEILGTRVAIRIVVRDLVF